MVTGQLIQLKLLMNQIAVNDCASIVTMTSSDSRLDVFMKENKHYSDVSFLVPLAALTLVGVVSIRTTSQHVSSSHLVP